jgi:hypothetical protein
MKRWAARKSASARPPSPSSLTSCPADLAERLVVARTAEALLLEILSDYQVSIPEIGTVSGLQIPMVFLTSNSSRDLSEALRRRCLYLYIDYPPAEREREIVRTRVPGISEHLAEQIAAIVGSLRRLDLRQHPSVAQTLEWAKTLLSLGAADLDAGLVADSLRTLPVGHRAGLLPAVPRPAPLSRKSATQKGRPGVCGWPEWADLAGLSRAGACFPRRGCSGAPAPSTYGGWPGVRRGWC